MERIHLATVIFCVTLLITVVRLVRREHIRVEYSMSWFAAAIGVLVLSFWNSALVWIGRLIGVEDPSFVLSLVAGLLFLYTFFRFSVEVSSLKDHNIVVSQKVAMLEWEIRQQREEIKRLKGGQSDSD